MEDSFKIYITTAIEVIIFSVVVAVIVALMGGVNSQYSDYITERQSIKSRLEYKEIQEYDSRQLDATEVVEIVTTYARLYKFNIITSSGTNTIDYSAEIASGGTFVWSAEYLYQNILNLSLNKQFDMTVNESTKTITFTEV